MSATGHEAAQRVLDRANAMIRELYGREARTLMWQSRDRRRIFRYSTERTGAGKFIAQELRAYGEGSRTKPVRWREVRQLAFAKRSTAKARALAWYTAYEESRKA